MTQEELDALLENNTDFENIEEIMDENETSEEEDAIYPPPADEKHRVVAQLDEVTKESDKKASEIMEILEKVNNNIIEQENYLKNLKEYLENNKNLLNKLHTKFPNIHKFKEELEKLEEAKTDLENSININNLIQEEIMDIIMSMQYQDIHRQKIERVINIMRALIKYMNKLFEGKIDDEERVKTADHIHGDETNNIVTDEDIEKLIEQFGGNN